MSYSRIQTPIPQQASFKMAGIFKPIYSSPKGVPMTPVRRRRLLFSYAPDWILTILLAVLFFSLDKVDGFRREFSLDDPTISFPYAVHERVPNLALIFICFVTPLLLMPIVNFVTVRSWWDLHNSTLGLILGLALTGSLTQIVKITVGRPRPDLIDRCQPPAGSVNPPFGLSNFTICTQTDNSIMMDGFRSFFSGHSSLSFAGLGFFAYYLSGKMHLFDTRGHAGKAWLALSPFMAACLVAISRTMDYRHHWQDVLVGSLVGTFFSYFAYRQYYPSLSSEFAHRPYSPRIKREEDLEVLPTHFAGPMQPGNHVRQYSDSFDDNGNIELAGTVPRPTGPGPLEEVWKQGQGVPVASRSRRMSDGSAERPATAPAFAPLRRDDERL